MGDGLDEIAVARRVQRHGAHDLPSVSARVMHQPGEHLDRFEPDVVIGPGVHNNAIHY